MLIKSVNRDTNEQQSHYDTVLNVLIRLWQSIEN